MAQKIEEGKLFYHLTPLKSLESIIQRGLMSRDSLAQNNITFMDTADPAILDERERLGLSQYIPFHFHIHTAYDTAVKNHNSDKYFVYICIRRSFAQNQHFSILPIHPASNERPNILNYDDGLMQIDWNVMNLKKSEAESQNISERYRNQVRMAECLSPSTINARNFHAIYVPNEKVKKFVKKLLTQYNVIPAPFVEVKDWFVYY